MTILSTPIEYFKKEAKKLFNQFKTGDTEAIERVLRVLKDTTDVSLMRIQHVIAVEYGYLKWEDLVTSSAVELHLAITMKKIPQLNDFGIGVSTGHRGLPKDERDAIFSKNRKVLRESIDSIAKTIDWLSAKIIPIKTLNMNQSSYGYKHLAEKDVGYITNGVFIAAAIIAGYPFEIVAGSPNVLFGMSKKSIKEVNRSRHSIMPNPEPTGTPLGSFLRGPGIIPTPPHLAELADKVDKMTLEEQRQYLDEDAHKMGLFSRK